jgi:hypothetical protein
MNVLELGERPAAGEWLVLALDPGALHLFDPETGASLLDDAEPRS